MSRLDSCNSTLWGLPSNQLIRLQKIHKTAVRIVTRTKSRDHITPVLRSLHWLPVSKRTEYKILCLTYQCVHKTAPQYLQELVSAYTPPRSLRSSSLYRFSVSGFGENTNKKHSGARSFYNAAPTLWNRLPDKLHQAKDIASFWRQLNCFQLYRSSHPPPLILVPSSIYLHRAPSACFSSTYHSPLQFSSYLPSQRACEFLHGVRLRSVSGH